MVFDWWKRRRRSKLLAAPFDREWRDILRSNVAAYERLSAEEQQRFENYLKVFIAEKHWEGCNGLVVTAEMKVTIAAGVARLTLGFQHEYFDWVQTILVYPDIYVGRDQRMAAPGVVLEGRSMREGEAWHRGPVILSWPDVLRDARGGNEGRNLVIHEFAHQLDMLNGGEADGIPPLATTQQQRTWATLIEEEYQQLRLALADGDWTLLDSYASKNRAEFFAVASEAFFEMPLELRIAHLELYEQLRGFYRQDPTQQFTD